MLAHPAHPVDSLVRDKLVLWNTRTDGLQSMSLGGYETRHDSVLSLLRSADEAHDLPAFGPVLVDTLDRPVSPIEHGWRSYAFCAAAGYRDVPVPDFVFGGWPQVGIDDYDETSWAMSSAGDQPAERPQVGWIGSCHTHPSRWTVHRLGQEHPDLLDVQHVEWVRDAARGRLQASSGNLLTLPEQVERWSALLDVEGKGYSGRLKLLLHSGRPVLVQDRPWREWYWDSLVPMEHFIPVRRDLSDLVEAARWVQQNPQEAAEIGRAGQKLAQQLLTRAAAVEQWGRTLTLAAAESEGPWAPSSLLEALEPRLRQLGAAPSGPS